jgi:hypothetical protein
MKMVTIITSLTKNIITIKSKTQWNHHNHSHQPPDYEQQANNEDGHQEQVAPSISRWRGAAR